MDGTNPKVSFIPKGSLVREESFLERRRPRSAIGLLAIFAFLVVAGSYGGLYYYGIKLSQEVGTKTDQIKQAQKIFSDAPQVGVAKLFRARADLAKELLASHTVISPVFAFISKNTLGSIMYDKFAYLDGANGATLSLSGEAPTYAALAYQADVLKKNTTEIKGFSIQDIALTKFGTVTFTLNLAVAPDYISYVKNSAGNETQTGTVVPEIPQIIKQTNAFPVSAPSPVLITLPDVSSTTTQPTNPDSLGGLSVTTEVTPSSPVTAVVSTSTQKQPAFQFMSASFWSSLWSRFKFW